MRIGFSNPFLAALGGGDRYLFSILAEAAAIPGADIELYAPREPDVAGWAAVGVEVDPARVRWLDLDDAAIADRSRDLDLLVALTLDVPPLCRAARGVAVVQFPWVDRGTPSARLRAQAGRLSGRGRALISLRSYERHLCYSEWARGWIARRLRVDATVLAPPVDVPGHGPAMDRDPAIVSVARFAPGGHAKRHDALIDAFRALDADGWTLHLVGTAGDDPASVDMVAALRERAAGLAVEFHVNAARADLDARLDRAALLWHGAGYGVDPERDPEQLEHFGIAVADGMAHGAVPLVVGAGGPAEIVRDGVDGRHWHALDELVAATRELIADPARAAGMRRAGYEAVGRYATPRFRAAVRRDVLRRAE